MAKLIYHYQWGTIRTFIIALTGTKKKTGNINFYKNSHPYKDYTFLEASEVLSQNKEAKDFVNEIIAQARADERRRLVEEIDDWFTENNYHVEVAILHSAMLSLGLAKSSPMKVKDMRNRLLGVDPDKDKMYAGDKLKKKTEEEGK